MVESGNGELKTRNNDCDGQVDEGVKITFFADTDGDGYGDPASTTEACSPPAGYVADNTDCNDTASSIYPNSPEICNNGIDDDCDGQTDETLITWTGNGDGTSWTDDANWDNGPPPQVCNDVVIPAGSLVILAATENAVCNTILVDSMATLIVEEGGVLDVQN